MTDRFNGVLVAFDRDIRDDDAEPLIAAIRMLKGVAGVSPNVVTPDSMISAMRADREWRQRIYDMVAAVPQ